MADTPNGEAVYQKVNEVLCAVNQLISIFGRTDQGDLLLDPAKGNVAFGCSDWGFTLGKFADLYSAKFGVDCRKMLTMLWGNHYYDQEKR